MGTKLFSKQGIQDGMAAFFVLILLLYITLLPMPKWLVYIRPDFFILAYIYYLLQDSPIFSYSFAMLAGVFLDVLLTNPIGTCMLAFIIITYISGKFNRQISYFPIMQQSSIVACIVCFYYVVLNVANLMTNSEFSFALVISKSISAFIFWPWIAYLLNQLYYRE